MRAAREALAEAADIWRHCENWPVFLPHVARIALRQRARSSRTQDLLDRSEHCSRVAPRRWDLYVNGAWERARRAGTTLRAFALCFDEEASWSEVERLAPSTPAPPLAC